MKIHIKMKHGDTFLHEDVFGNSITYKAISIDGTACVSFLGFYENYIRASLEGERVNPVLVSVRGVVEIL